jgi:hypothetical protein
MPDLGLEALAMSRCAVTVGITTLANVLSGAASPADLSPHIPVLWRRLPKLDRSRRTTMGIFASIMNRIFHHESAGGAASAGAAAGAQPQTANPAQGVPAGADGSAEENIALHKTVMAKLAANGGVVPDGLRN